MLTAEGLHLPFTDTTWQMCQLVWFSSYKSVYVNYICKHKKWDATQVLLTHILKKGRLHKLKRYWNSISFGNWAKLHVSQVFPHFPSFEEILCRKLYHCNAWWNYLWKAMLLHCSNSFFNLLFLLLDFTLKKSRKPYKRSNSAMEKVDLTIFKIQLKPKKLKSTIFCGTDCLYIQLVESILLKGIMCTQHQHFFQGMLGIRKIWQRSEKLCSFNAFLHSVVSRFSARTYTVCTHKQHY